MLCACRGCRDGDGSAQLSGTGASNKGIRSWLRTICPDSLGGSLLAGDLWLDERRQLRQGLLPAEVAHFYRDDLGDTFLDYV